MNGEHRYHSAPASDEYRENFDRIFRQVEDGYISYPRVSGTEFQEAAKETILRAHRLFFRDDGRLCVVETA